MPGYMAVDVDRHRHARDVRREPFDVDLQRCRAALQPHRPDVELVDLFEAFPFQLAVLFILILPKNQVLRFGLFPFRSPLLRKSIFLSPPIAT